MWRKLCSAMFLSVDKQMLATSAKEEGFTAVVVGVGGEASKGTRRLSKDCASSFWRRPIFVMKCLVSFGGALGSCVVTQVIFL
jgi:hypothetical protein